MHITPAGRTILADLDTHGRPTSGHPSALTALARSGVLRLRIDGAPASGPQRYEITEQARREGLAPTAEPIHYAADPATGGIRCTGPFNAATTYRTADADRVTCEDCRDHMRVDAGGPPGEDAFVAVTPAGGGKVHDARLEADVPRDKLLPICRQDRGQRHWTAFVPTKAPVDCSRCTTFRANRAARRAEVAAARERIAARAAQREHAAPPAVAGSVTTRFGYTDDYADDVAVRTLCDRLTAAGHAAAALVQDGSGTWRTEGSGFTIDRQAEYLVVRAVRDGVEGVGDAHALEAWGHLLRAARYVVVSTGPDHLTVAARPAPASRGADVSGPYGVFEDGLCVEVADGYAEAEGYADRYRAADDATDVTVEPLCAEHRDTEQPRHGCEECLTDNEADEDDAEDAVHLRTPDGTLCGEGGRDTAGTATVTCPLCRDALDAEADDAQDEEEEDDDEYAEPPAEGRVIAHQGSGRGTEPAHADNPHARAAAEALAAAGLALAELGEEYDPETSTANGYMAIPHGTDADGDPWVYVYHLVDGQMVHPHTREPWRQDLRRALSALRDAGWAVEPRTSVCVRACRTAPAAPVPQYDRSRTLAAVGSAERAEREQRARDLVRRTRAVDEQWCTVLVHAPAPGWAVVTVADAASAQEAQALREDLVECLGTETGARLVPLDRGVELGEEEARRRHAFAVHIRL